MATIYLSSVDGNDADNGSTWALAKATLAAALTAAGSGGTVYVDHSHAESQASAMTLASPGTAASPVTVICVDRTGNPEPPTSIAFTATVNTTGNFGITFSGFAYCFGITFNSGTSGNSNSIQVCSGVTAGMWIFESCTLAIGAGSSTAMTFGAASSTQVNIKILLINTKLAFSNASNTLNIRQCEFIWVNTASALLGTLPTTLFNVTYGSPVLIAGVDLSAAGSGKTLFDLSDPTPAKIVAQNCKLGSSVTIAGGTHPGHGGVELELVNCDSADTNYRYEKRNYTGTVTQETTIVRTGGASDGTTGLSHKFVSSANTKFYAPLAGPWINLWNETTGSSITLTAEVVTDNVTLTDAEAWIEVEHLGTIGFPLSVLAHDRATDVLATPANQSSSSETWTTTGLGTPVKQKLAASFTPYEKGPIRARVCLARASTTVYACPKLEVS